jgi:hypothetical protein
VRPMPAQVRRGTVWPGTALPGAVTSSDEDLREIAVVGAHGGSGTTTLAALLHPAWDLGVVQRPERGRPAIRSGGRPIVLVTRNTAAAAARATAAVNAIGWHGECVAVLAIVSDGMPAPAAASYRFQLLAARVGAVVRVPFIASLRAADDPAQADLPRRARQSIARIRGEALSRAAGPAHIRPTSVGAD